MRFVALENAKAWCQGEAWCRHMQQKEWVTVRFLGPITSGTEHDPNARRTLPFRAGKGSADAEGIHGESSKALLLLDVAPNGALVDILLRRSRVHALAKLSVYRGKCRCCRACSKVTFAPCNAFKRSNTNFGPTASNVAIWAALPGRAGSFTTRHWRCKRPTTRRVAHSSVTW